MSINIAVSDKARERPSVLCLNSLQFNRDVKVLQRESTKYAWSTMQDIDLASAQHQWIPPRAQFQGIYVNQSGADIDEGWAKARELGLAILRSLLDQGIKLAAVMAGNWDYWNEECLRLACTELNIPFLVLMREHDLTANRWKDGVEFWGQMNRMPNVAGVAFAGDASLHLVAELDLFPRSKLRVTGWPRLDLWRLPVTPSHLRPIVLMSYSKGYNADQHFIEMMDLFAAISRRHPETPFIVKAKHAGDLAILRRVSEERRLGLNVIDTPNLPALLSNARAVVGFMSVTMYEALLSPARIIVPRWGQTDQDPRLLAPSPMDENLYGHMDFVRSPDALTKAIESCMDAEPSPVNMEERRNLFGRYFSYSHDQTATQRVEDFVDEFGRRW